MPWWASLFLLVGGVFGCLMVGVPVAFSFLFVNIVGGLLFMGPGGMNQMVLSVFNSVSSFVLAPVPLFILLGYVMFHSKMAHRALDVVEVWLGKVPGRLSFLAVGGGTVFASLSGSSMASAAMLGSTLIPEMQRRGYSKAMTLGPILGSGGIAVMIPPSSLGVVLGSLAFVPIGRLLIGGVIPGLLLTALYTLYMIGVFTVNPASAPAYDVPHTPLSRKIHDFAAYVLPLAVIVFLVVGLIVLGIATPSESAAMGAIGAFLLAAVYGKLNWMVAREALAGTLKTSVMVLMIIAGATGFSQLLSFSGAARGLVTFVLSLDLSPMVLLCAMMLGLLILGCFVEQTSMLMITIPLYMPIVHALGFDTVWFAILVLLTLEMAATTPPFGLVSFVVKGLAPEGTTMGDVYRAGLPYLACDFIAMILILAFPAIVTWLPGFIR